MHTTGGNDELDIVFWRKSVTDTTTLNQNVKTLNRPTQKPVKT